MVTNPPSPPDYHVARDSPVNGTIDADELPTYGEAMRAAPAPPQLQRSRTAPAPRPQEKSSATTTDTIPTHFASDEELARFLQQEEERATRSWAHDTDSLRASSGPGRSPGSPASVTGGALFGSARRMAAGTMGTFTGWDASVDNGAGRVNGGMGIDPRLARREEERQRRKAEKEREKLMARRATIAAPEGAAGRRDENPSISAGAGAGATVTNGTANSGRDGEGEAGKKKGKGKEVVRRAGRWLADATGYTRN